MNELSQVQQIAAAIIPILFAITVHEAAHGWVANKLGDPTAKMLGRLTFNPLKHIDPLGTILVPAMSLMLGGFLFGWAKPVPVTPQNFNNPKRDMAIVAAAGPISNFLMALFWAALFTFSFNLQASTAALALKTMGQYGMLINLILMVLNLIPIPPLDGSRVVASILKGRMAYHYSQIEPYGLFIILGLLFLGALGGIIFPIVNMLQYFILTLF